jgi:hypothetical protein
MVNEKLKRFAGNDTYQVLDCSDHEFVKRVIGRGGNSLCEAPDGRRMYLKEIKSQFNESIEQFCNEVVCSKIGQFLDLDVVENNFAHAQRDDGTAGVKRIASTAFEGETVPVEQYYSLVYKNFHEVNPRCAAVDMAVQAIDPITLDGGLGGYHSKMMRGWPLQVVRNTLLLHADTSLGLRFGRNAMVYKDTGEWAPGFDFEFCLGDGELIMEQKEMNRLFETNIRYIPQDLVDKVAALSPEAVDKFTWLGGLEEYLERDTEFVEGYQRKKSLILNEQRDFILETKAKFNKQSTVQVR